ncbi:MAG: MaoC family dehydratase N-terminal domain-containing protein [Vannielia sp.]|uniref:FAS1-like dehydratase domain-containing protein n=1 Tax=Vannielia sp. TaxID=2813045 RepID=UPI003B8CAF07
MTVETEGKFSAYIGRSETLSERIDPARVAALAATLDLPEAPGQGAALPPGWHWLFFNPFVRRSGIGPDGHPKRGGFLPDVKLPRRMWAGGRLRYHAPLVIGELAEKQSEILNVVEKSGRAGQLVFVTVRHRLSQGGRVAIEEEQDIVYREAAASGAPKPPAKPAPEAAQSEQIIPDPVLLFRFSALTSNGHRIHYDRAYARDEEDYRDLVVHGPLTAVLLQGLAVASRPDATLSSFTFRGVAPLFADRPFRIETGSTQASELDLWARGPDDELAMSATAEFQPGGAA